MKNVFSTFLLELLIGVRMRIGNRNFLEHEIQLIQEMTTTYWIYNPYLSYRYRIDINLGFFARKRLTTALK